MTKGGAPAALVPRRYPTTGSRAVGSPSRSAVQANAEAGRVHQIEEVGGRLRAIRERQLKAADGDVLVFLNPDTEILDSSFEELVRARSTS